jgi:hypothetical protein
MLSARYYFKGHAADHCLMRPMTARSHRESRGRLHCGNERVCHIRPDYDCANAEYAHPFFLRELRVQERARSLATGGVIVTKRAQRETDRKTATVPAGRKGQAGRSLRLVAGRRTVTANAESCVVKAPREEPHSACSSRRSSFLSSAVEGARSYF